MSVVLKYITVYLLSTFKFILGPVLGLSYGFGVVETSLLTLGGMMTSVYAFCYFGIYIRRLSQKFLSRKKKNIFSSRNRKFVKIWSRYGVKGIAFFTPILLSPPIGTILANAFGGRRSEIIKWMWVFGTFFSFLITTILKYASWIISDFITLP